MPQRSTERSCKRKGESEENRSPTTLGVIFLGMYTGRVVIPLFPLHLLPVELFSRATMKFYLGSKATPSPASCKKAESVLAYCIICQIYDDDD